MRSDANYPLYGWLLIVGVFVFGFYLLWYFSFLSRLLEADITYLSAVILVLFAGVTIYLGLAAKRLSKQRRFTLALECDRENSLILEQHGSWAKEHLQLLDQNNAKQGNESDSLFSRLVEQVHRGHNSGWFLSDILVRLGLIGTVIGFMLMLSSVYDLKQNDVQKLQQLLVTMSGGMQVALYTTLSGLGTALLVSIQCQWLDRCADQLVSQIIKLGIKDG